MKNTESNITLKSELEIQQEVQKLLSSNNLDGARKILEEVLENDKDNLNAMFVLAQISEYEGKFDEAAKYYQKTYKSDMQKELKERIAYVYEQADNYDAAFDIYKEFYEKEPNDKNAIERFANCCSILKKYDMAVELYNKILTKEPDDIVALRQLIDIYEDTNKMMYHLFKARVAEIENTLSHALSEYKKALALAEEDEDILNIRYKLAQLYKQTGKLENALDEYTYILSISHDNFSIYLELAQIYEDMGNMAASVDILEKAHKIYTNNEEVSRMLADMLYETEQFEKAKTLLEKLCSDNKKDIELNITLAKTYLELGKIEETGRILVELEKVHPDATEVLVALAGFYTLKDDFEKAKSYCNRIIKKLPSSPLGYGKLAQLYEKQKEDHLSHYNYGLYHELKGEIEEATDEFIWALHYKDDDFASIEKLANIYEKNNEIDLAIEYLEKLLKFDVNTEETAYKLGKLYIEQGDIEATQRFLQETINEHPQAIELYLLNADCLYKLKNYEEALEAYRYYQNNTKSCETIDYVKEQIEKTEKKLSGEKESLFSKIFPFLK